MADDPTDRMAKALKNTLDSHGYSFQSAVARCCEELFDSKASSWRFEVAEFPVEAKGGPTHIDFVLRAKPEHINLTAYLVCECKRPNPAIGNWAFVRAPYTRRDRSMRFTVFETIWWDSSQGRVLSAPRKFRDLIEPYDLGKELRGDPQGDPEFGGRGAIEDAITQVLRGTSGLIDFFQNNPNLIGENSIFIPVVFTTARLFTSAVDLGTADLRTGKLPGDLTAEESAWLWFQYNLSAGLRHSLPRILSDGPPLTSLGSVLEYQHARSIAVVGPDGIREFLAQMPANLEDLEMLRP